MELVHDWVAFPTVQIQGMSVKLRVEGVELSCKRAGLPFPLPRCMMCCKVRSDLGAKLSLLYIEMLTLIFHF